MKKIGGSFKRSFNLFDLFEYYLLQLENKGKNLVDADKNHLYHLIENSEKNLEKILKAFKFLSQYLLLLPDLDTRPEFVSFNDIAEFINNQPFKKVMDTININDYLLSKE